MNFGYKVIDFKGAEIDTTGITIKGIGDTIEGYLTGEKFIVCANLKIDGYDEVSPFVPIIHKNSGSYIIPIDNAYYIEVTSADLVKVVAYV